MELRDFEGFGIWGFRVYSLRASCMTLSTLYNGSSCRKMTTVCGSGVQGFRAQGLTSGFEVLGSRFRGV